MGRRGMAVKYEIKCRKKPDVRQCAEKKSVFLNFTLF